MVPDIVVLAEAGLDREPVPAEPVPDEGAVAGAEAVLNNVLVVRPDRGRLGDILEAIGSIRERGRAGVTAVIRIRV